MGFYNRGLIRFKIFRQEHVFKRPPGLVQDPWSPRWFKVGAQIRDREGGDIETREAWGADFLGECLDNLCDWIQTIGGEAPTGRGWEHGDFDDELSPEQIVSVWYRFVLECMLDDDTRERLKKSSGSGMQPGPTDQASTTVDDVPTGSDITEDVQRGLSETTPTNGTPSPPAASIVPC
jgi:hypothetical protein